MRLLLDTSVFIYFIADSPRLSEAHYAAIQNPANQIYLSIASVWEAVIKYQLGKLPLPEPAHLYLPEERVKHDILSLEIDEGAIAYLPGLPNHHKDPFDRIIVCQSLEHEMTIVTNDPLIRKYPVMCLD